MNKIGNHPKYGAIYDNPGATGGGSMFYLNGVGWVRNPNYPNKPEGNGGGGGGGGLYKWGGTYYEIK